jgi:hypothetical protein
MVRLVDLDRFRAPVLVIGAVLGVLVAIDVGLRLSLGEMPRALLRASFHDARLHDEVAGRVSAVVARRTPDDPPLAVIVGSSSARAGLRPAALAAADPAHHRWLNLAGTGSSFDELRYTFEPLFASRIDADVAVVAVHPGWLAGRIVGDPAFDAILVSRSASRRSWLLFHQGRLAAMTRASLASVRERWLLALGVRFDAVYTPDGDPWRGYDVAHGVLDLIRDRGQITMWKRKRWFEPAWYARASEERANAAAVVGGCQRVARRVVVVLMPESSALRAALPPEAEASLRAALATLRAPPRVIDLRAAIPDALFADHIHLNEHGATILSMLVARAIGDTP